MGRRAGRASNRREHTQELWSRKMHPPLKRPLSSLTCTQHHSLLLSRHPRFASPLPLPAWCAPEDDEHGRADHPAYPRTRMRPVLLHNYAPTLQLAPSPSLSRICVPQYYSIAPASPSSTTTFCSCQKLQNLRGELRRS